MIEEPDDFNGVTIAEWWDWNSRYLEWFTRCIPTGDEPEIVSSGDPNESSYREPQARWAAEEELLEPTRALLNRFFDEMDWVVKCDCMQTLFFAEERLRWGSAFCRMLSRLPSLNGVSGLGSVELSAGEIWKWVTLEVYDAEFAFPVRWSEKSCAW